MKTGATQALLGVVLAAALVQLPVAAQTPSPSPPVPSPSASGELREIGHVRVSALCTMLHDSVGPTIGGMMKNDELIGASHRAFSKMSQDLTLGSSAAVQLDRTYLSQVESRLVKNLRVIDSVIKKQPAETAAMPPADKPDAATLSAQLASVAAAQRNALNLVAGILDTESLGQIQSEGSDQMKNSLDPNGSTLLPGGSTGDEPASYLGAAGLPEYSPATGLPTLSTKTSDLHGHTVYDEVISNLESMQVTIGHRERTATVSVQNAIATCKARLDAQATPSPLPSPT